MIKSYLQKSAEVKRKWVQIDAAKYPLGRLASRVATLLRGKHKPTFTPYVDGGDFVVVINAGQVKLTGRKLNQKEYISHSGYPGGVKRNPLRKMMEKRPEKVIYMAVENMLAPNRLRKHMLRRLKIIADSKHSYRIDKTIAN